MPYSHEIIIPRAEKRSVYTPAGKGYYLCQLASGEEFVVRSEGQASSWTEGSLSNGLLDEACETTMRIRNWHGNKEDFVWPARLTLYESAKRVLSRIRDPYSNNCYRDTEIDYFAKGIADGKPFPEQVLPHWVFLSIAYDLHFWRETEYHTVLGGQHCSVERTEFVSSQPRFIKLRPTDEELKETSFDRESFTSLLMSTPPIMISKAVPVLGFGDNEYGYVFRPKTTLLREGSGLSNGKLVFPGGHVSCPLDLTAWRELNEEVAYTGLTYATEPHEVRLVALIDQAFFNGSNELEHFYVSIFYFAINCGPLTEDYLIEKLEPRSSDGKKSEWVSVALNPESGKLINQEVRQRLGAVERLALSCTEYCLPPSIRSGYSITVYR